MISPRSRPRAGARRSRRGGRGQGSHARDGLKRPADGPWTTQIAEPARRTMLHWHGDHDTRRAVYANCGPAALRRRPGRAPAARCCASGRSRTCSIAAACAGPGSAGGTMSPSTTGPGRRLQSGPPDARYSAPAPQRRRPMPASSRSPPAIISCGCCSCAPRPTRGASRRDAAAAHGTKLRRAERSQG